MLVRKLSPELKEKAFQDFGEDEKRTPEDIKYIKTWLEQNKFIISRTDDQWILSFLRGCKYSLEITKQRLESHNTLRTLLPEFYKNRNPFDPHIQTFLKQGCYLPISSPSPTSPRPLIIREGLIKALTDEAKIAFLKLNLMLQDIFLMEDDQAVISGFYIIHDMKEISFNSMLPLTVMKKILSVWQEGYPIRPQGLFFINVNAVFEKMFSIAKPFINEKMRNRVFIFTSSDIDKFHKIVDQKILPKEYGGNGPTISEIADELKKKVESYNDWFIDDEKYGTDETKRPGKGRTCEDYFGIEGSFRKLDVD